MKFLFDLFPLILFFVAFKLWGIFAATAATIAATLIQIVWSAFRHRKVDPTLWVNLVIIAVLGGATLMFHNENFIKWKPTALYWLFSVTLIASQCGFNKNPIKAMLGTKITLPQYVWGKLNIAWATFFAALGTLNLLIAYYFSTDTWVNFKLFGGMACIIVFIIAQSVWLAKYLHNDSKPSSK